MKNLKLICVLLTVVLSMSSCSNDDDEVALSAEQLLVLQSPWSFDAHQLVDIINNGNTEFNKEDWETNASDTDFGYIFNSDGTGSELKGDVLNPESITDITWEVINGTQLKLTGYNENGDVWYTVTFDDLIVSHAYLEFVLKNAPAATNVTAGVKYIFSN